MATNATAPNTNKNTPEWNEERVNQSRLQNLAKAREVQRAKVIEKNAGFTTTPVASVAENPEIAQALPNDVVEEKSGLATSSYTFALALLTFAAPLAINALIDYAYPRMRDYFTNYSASSLTESGDQRSKKQEAQWQGQSLFRQ
jgi:hypothetical protein